LVRRIAVEVVEGAIRHWVAKPSVSLGEVDSNFAPLAGADLVGDTELVEAVVNLEAFDLTNRAASVEAAVEGVAAGSQINSFEVQLEALAPVRQSYKYFPSEQELNSFQSQ
jgi:hypothetical protein